VPPGCRTPDAAASSTCARGPDARRHLDARRHPAHRRPARDRHRRDDQSARPAGSHRRHHHHRHHRHRGSHRRRHHHRDDQHHQHRDDRLHLVRLGRLGRDDRHRRQHHRHRVGPRYRRVAAASFPDSAAAASCPDSGVVHRAVRLRRRAPDGHHRAADRAGPASAGVGRRVRAEWGVDRADRADRGLGGELRLVGPRAAGRDAAGRLAATHRTGCCPAEDLAWAQAGDRDGRRERPDRIADLAAQAVRQRTLGRSARCRCQPLPGPPAPPQRAPPLGSPVERPAGWPAGLPPAWRPAARPLWLRRPEPRSPGRWSARTVAAAGRGPAERRPAAHWSCAGSAGWSRRSRPSLPPERRTAR
jgi:hypothetical protein